MDEAQAQKVFAVQRRARLAELDASFVAAMKDQKYAEALRFARTVMELEPASIKYREFIPLLEEKVANDEEAAEGEDEDGDEAGADQGEGEAGGDDDDEGDDDEEDDDDDDDYDDEEEDEEDEEDASPAPPPDVADSIALNVSNLSMSKGARSKMHASLKSATENEILSFFADFNLDADAVYLRRHDDGRPNGEAFVVFESPSEARRAIQKDRETFGDKFGERYVRVYPSLDTDVADLAAAVAQRGLAPMGASHADSVLKMKSLPFEATQLDVIQFFEEFKMKPNGVQLLVRCDNKPTGEAFVEFESADEAARAIREKDHKVFSEKFGDRYVRLIQVSHKEMQAKLALRFGGEGILKMKGIPFKASTSDVRKFFAGYRIKHGAISFIMHPDGRPTGMAFIEFETPQEAVKVLDKDRAKFGPEYGDRYCMLQLVGRHEMEKVVLLRECDMPNGGGVPGLATSGANHHGHQGGGGGGGGLITGGLGQHANGGGYGLGLGGLSVMQAAALAHATQAALAASPALQAQLLQAQLLQAHPWLQLGLANPAALQQLQALSAAQGLQHGGGGLLNGMHAMGGLGGMQNMGAMGGMQNMGGMGMLGGNGMGGQSGMGGAMHGQYGGGMGYGGGNGGMHGGGGAMNGGCGMNGGGGGGGFNPALLDAQLQLHEQLQQQLSLAAGGNGGGMGGFNTGEFNGRSNNGGFQQQHQQQQQAGGGMYGKQQHPGGNSFGDGMVMPSSSGGGAAHGHGPGSGGRPDSFGTANGSALGSLLSTNHESLVSTNGSQHSSSPGSTTPLGGPPLLHSADDSIDAAWLASYGSHGSNSEPGVVGSRKPALISRDSHDATVSAASHGGFGAAGSGALSLLPYNAALGGSSRGSIDWGMHPGAGSARFGGLTQL
ncbi:hypothetical protein FOA52_015450 [Chlamydomonas sp. UWO 241]|nr:hypothetical protein FOA52_015450 [Chlamydomonas sp. UWO 241]